MAKARSKRKAKKPPRAKPPLKGYVEDFLAAERRYRQSDEYSLDLFHTMRALYQVAPAPLRKLLNPIFEQFNWPPETTPPDRLLTIPRPIKFSVARLANKYDISPDTLKKIESYSGKSHAASSLCDDHPWCDTNEQLILWAMWELNKVGPESRVSKEPLMKKAFGPSSKAENYTRPLATLAHKGLIITKRGPRGGAYLSNRGQAVAKKLKF